MEAQYYLDLVRARLGDDRSSLVNTHGNVPTEIFPKDGYAVVQTYTDDQIHFYLEISLQRLNLLFGKRLDIGELSLLDPETLSWTDLLVQGAVITALAAKAAVERGREFGYEQEGVSWNPPDVASILMQQWESELVDYRYKVGLILNYPRS